MLLCLVAKIKWILKKQPRLGVRAIASARVASKSTSQTCHQEQVRSSRPQLTLFYPHPSLRASFRFSLALLLTPRRLIIRGRFNLFDHLAPYTFSTPPLHKLHHSCLLPTSFVFAWSCQQNKSTHNPATYMNCVWILIITILTAGECSTGSPATFVTACLSWI